MAPHSVRARPSWFSKAMSTPALAAHQCWPDSWAWVNHRMRGISPAPDAEGAARALRACLADAGVPANRVGYVNAHGTATVLNDLTEAAALRAVLGTAANAAWTSSTKGAHGHLLGAAGAMEALITVQALRYGVVPPNVGTTVVDATCALNIAVAPLACELELALSNTLAFGGLNVVLAFGH
jgi:3-oxoacyl-(acyl-carrier-protein) synthase